MDTYLLDTNVISVAMQPSDARYAAVRSHLDRRQVYIWVPVLAIAELEFGMACANQPLADGVRRRHDDVRRFFGKYEPHYGFDRGTVEPYSLIRAELWRRLGTLNSDGRGYVEKDPSEFKDRVTGIELGIDEKDLMIAAVAAQYGVMLATVDRNVRMQRIEEAARVLEERGLPTVLRVVDWSIPV